MSERSLLGAVYWDSNAELIVDFAALGYLHEDWRTLDPTYGKGVWWKVFRPRELVTYCRPKDGSDFRHLPEEDESFLSIAFDPPYVCAGGRETSTLPGFQEAYGMHDAPKTPAALQKMNDEGLAEMFRLLAPGGFLLVKGQDYISGGKLWDGTYRTQKAAEALGLKLWDRAIHLTEPRPQPKGRTRKVKGERVPTEQQHFQCNFSVLLVFRKNRRRK